MEMQVEEFRVVGRRACTKPLPPEENIICDQDAPACINVYGCWVEVLHEHEFLILPNYFTRHPSWYMYASFSKLRDQSLLPYIYPNQRDGILKVNTDMCRI